MTMRIALAGLGNVGAATLRILQTQAELLKNRCGQDLQIVAVSARQKNKTRDCDLNGVEWVDDPRAFAKRNDIDIVIETIGGADGIAFEIAKSALASGKHFVTANKAMIATHGVALAKCAEKTGIQISFEAAVCGGLPVLKMLREGLAANNILSLKGILNGTCNYILTRMHDVGMDFSTALGEAQAKGYAEADPSNDIDGLDSAYKLAILSALAFGTCPNISAIFVEGIRHITPKDLQDADARGGRIKLIGISTPSSSGIIQHVQPVFVPLKEPLARVPGSENAVEISGQAVGKIFLQGAGAGGDATASAIIADLVDIARGHRSFAFGIAAEKIEA